MKYHSYFCLTSEALEFIRSRYPNLDDAGAMSFLSQNTKSIVRSVVEEKFSNTSLSPQQRIGLIEFSTSDPNAANDMHKARWMQYALNLGLRLGQDHENSIEEFYEQVD